MKITIELPDKTALGFMNIAYFNSEGTMMLGSFSIDSNDLENGYVNLKEKVDKT
jgi:hypothetical protein